MFKFIYCTLAFVICFVTEKQARQAYLIGNKALAKELSDKGKLHNVQMKAAHGKAQESIYRQRFVLCKFCLIPAMTDYVGFNNPWDFFVILPTVVKGKCP